MIFNNKFEHKILNVHKDNDCNMLAIEVKFLLVNIYGLIKTAQIFFISDVVAYLIATLLSGDFNFVQNKNLDYYNYIK